MMMMKMKLMMMMMNMNEPFLACSRSVSPREKRGKEPCGCPTASVPEPGRPAAVGVEEGAVPGGLSPDPHAWLALPHR